ncbi:TRI39 ligase, partial [Ciccaba nigrolineata]|nr:TRI39 ligase [Ciccaba nigrolineata]
LETLRVEASCSVCLEYLQDPVIIECGHNFCRRCITRWWAELARDFPCPVCRKTSRHRALRPNRQLGNMVEAARQLRGAKRKAREESRCQAHGQALARFCRDDQAPVCLLCEISHAHRAHALVPLDDAALEYKVGGEPQIFSGAKGWFWPQIRPLELVLEGFWLSLVSRLHFQPQIVPQNHWGGGGWGHQGHPGQVRTPQALPAALPPPFRGRKAEFEAGGGGGGGVLPINQHHPTSPGAAGRCEAAAAPLEEPISIPIELEKNFGSFPRQYFTLRKITRRLIGEVTLDPDTAHPNLVLSEDRKSVRFVDARPRDLPDTPRRFTIYPCVLGAQGFTSGRHYWEVEVGDKTHWALGVCKDSVSRKGEFTPLPETGYWRVRLWNGDKYAATTTPFTPLTVRVKPKRVGVFVDYEAGQVAFYNVTDRSHIYTFTDTFTEKIWPLFYPGIRAGRKNAAPLVIRSPTDWE